MIGRSQGPLAVTACLLGLGACTAPDEHTDLRPSGAPEVLTVLVANSDDGFLETATFCKTNDDKRPGLVPANPDFDPSAAVNPAQICSDDLSVGATMVTDAVPVNWYVRIQFDELLDPDVEELDEIKDSEGNSTDRSSGTLLKNSRGLPVRLSCGGVDVPYDGYYDVSGNAFTWPLGPSLFIQPTEFLQNADVFTIPTGSECQLSLEPDVVVDKDSVAVPMDQLGPFNFKIADMAVTSTEPAQADLTDENFVPEKISPAAPLVITFNARIDLDSLDSAEVTIAVVDDCKTPSTDTHAAAIGAHTVNDKVDKLSAEIRDATATGDNAWLPSTTYLITFAGSVTEQAGGVGVLPADLTVCFTTNEAP
jgi:hypothetical protein